MEDFFERPAPEENDSSAALLEAADADVRRQAKGGNKQEDAGDRGESAQIIADLMRSGDIAGSASAVKEHFSKQPDPEAMKALAQKINENLRETKTAITLSVAPFRSHRKNQAVSIKGLETYTMEVPVGPGKNVK